MAIHLTIKTHGLVALVPSPTDKRLVALLCEAPAELVKPHQSAYVRFPTARFSTRNSRKPNKTSPDGLFQHIELNRERLSIVANVASADSTLRINRSDNPRVPEPTGEDDKSVIWLPRVQDLAPGSGDIKAAYFNSVANVVPRLLARVDFTQGRVGTTGVERIQVPFRTSSGREVVRPMARELMLELDIEDDFFILRSDPLFGVRDPANDLRFEGSGDIELVFGNESTDDIHRETPEIKDIDTLAADARKEAQFYFSLCQRSPKDPLLPHVAARPGLHTFCYNQLYNATAAVDGDSSNAETLTAAVASELPPWAMYAYVALDNNLRIVGLTDVRQLASANPSAVSVVTQIDVPDQPTRREVLGNGGFVATEDGPIRNVNSADPRELTDFLVSARKLRPADNEIVVIASHGTGLLDIKLGTRPPAARSSSDGNGNGNGNAFTRPFMAEMKQFALKMQPFLEKMPPALREMLLNLAAINNDDTAGDFMDNQELEQGLRGALNHEGPFGILGLDACLMSLVEIAYQVRLCAQYFVASQQDLDVDGWPYDDILRALPNADTPRKAAVAIVDAFAQSQGADNPSGRTLSAVDLKAMDRLARSLDELGGELVHSVPALTTSLDAARNAAHKFAHLDYIDLYGFVSELKAQIKRTLPIGRQREQLQTAADNVLKEIKTAVVRTSDPKEPSVSGLSVYLPTAPVAPEYHKLAIANDAPRWHDFVVAYGDTFSPAA